MDAPYFKILYLDSSPDRENVDEFVYRLKPFQDSPIFEGTTAEFEKLTKGEDVKTSYEVTFNVKNCDYEFQPGDAIAIFPENDEIEVENLLKRLKLDNVCDKCYEIETFYGKKLPKHIPPRGVTLRQLFLKYVDIRSVPKKIFLKCLINWTFEYADRTGLEFICSPFGSKAYEHLISSRRSLLQLLEEFPSCQPSVELILQNSTSLKPRYFSIASSPLHKNKLSIIFSVLEFEKDLKGVCTGWLQGMLEKNVPNIEKRVSFYFRKNSGFQIINDLEGPKILIGCGTGIAPFIGFLRFINHIKKEEMKNSETIWLFYGCRYEHRDFLCKNEITNYSEKSLIRLNTAFSREQSTKEYVQGEIEKNPSEFVNLILENGANVFICGDAKTMVKDIWKTIVECISKVRNIDAPAAEEIFECCLVKTKRYFVDSWI